MTGTTWYPTGTYDDWVKRTEQCQHPNGWEYIGEERERCRDCCLVRVNENLGRM